MKQYSHLLVLVALLGGVGVVEAHEHLAVPLLGKVLLRRKRKRKRRGITCGNIADGRKEGIKSRKEEGDGVQD